jgi:hypothetical protein
MDRIVIPSRILLDVHTGEERVEVVFRRRGRWRTAVVDRTALGQTRSIVEALRPLGANIDITNAAEVVRWISAFEELNEERLPRTQSTSRCGWHKLDDEWTFIAPGLVESNGIVFDGSDGRDTIVRGVGVAEGASLEAHVDSFQRAWNASPVAAVAIATALSAPLLRLLGVPNYMVHKYGDSSTGKSSKAMIAATTYGNPRDGSWFPSWNATLVSLEVRAHTLCDLPFFADEVGAGDPRHTQQAIYMLGGGVGRTRGRRDGGLRQTRAWNTVMISTGETSLTAGHVATGAKVRSLELFVDGFGGLDAHGVDALREQAIANHGAIGRRWIETIVGLDRDGVLGLRQEFRQAVQDVRTDSPAGSLAARQAISIALLELTASLASEWLGFGDEATIQEYFRRRQAEPEAKVETAPERALRLCRSWMMEQPRSFPELVLDSNGRTVAREGSGSAPICGFRRGGEVFFLREPFEAFLRERNLDSTAVKKGWAVQRLLNHDRGRLDRMVRINGDRERFVCLRYRRDDDD